MKKKIVISANSSWNIKNFRFSLIDKLINKYEIYILAPKDEYTEDILKKNINFYDLNINRRGVSLFQELILIYNYFKLLNKIKPDLYIGYTIKPNIYGNIVCYILNIKSITNITGLGSVFISKSFISYIVRFLYKITLKFSNAVIFQNNYDLNYFLKNNIATLNNSFLIKGSGVDTDKFIYSNNVLGKKIKFLYAGRILHEKGFFELMDSISYIKSEFNNIEFTIIGSYENSRNNLVKKSQLDKWKKSNIAKFIDYKENIIDDLQKCNCVILPSYREGLSMFLLEAISSGRPALVSDVPGCNDIIQNGYNGFLFKPKNSIDLTDKIIKFINLNPKKILEMGINGRKLAENKYDKSIINFQLSKIIYKLID